MKILVAGGAGYVGAVLTPKLLKEGHLVRILDLMIYGKEVLPKHPNLELIKGDVRNKETVEKCLQDIDVVIHLACISNDPSFDLNPELGRSINYDSFGPFVDSALEAKIQRFIFASSSSVYGIKDDPNVTEDLPLKPLTDYSFYKAACEKILLEKSQGKMTSVIIRPATVCGYSPRQRLDVIVNMFVNLAYNNKSISIFGGKQLRPNIHIDDMTDLYLRLCTIESKLVDQKIYNAGADNYSVETIATTVAKHIPEEISLSKTPSDDPRSYHISSDKITNELDFHFKKGIEEAIDELIEKFKQGKLPNGLTNTRYHNIKKMKEINLR